VAAGRNPLQQPFASDSIWNMPIGSAATYVAAGLPGLPNTSFNEMPGIDPMRICLTPDAPVCEVKYSDAGWSGADRCAPTTSEVLGTVVIPTSYIVPNSNQNECGAFLAPDGHTVKQCQPFTRCTEGSAATAVVMFADEDLYEQGIGGAQGGSRLSALGGTIRLGEMRPGQTGIPHPLKMTVNSYKYFYEATTDAETFRWPAATSDSGSVGNYGSETHNTNIEMRMGSLLALQPTSTLPSTLRTEPGRQLAWTLQNYGIYIVDESGHGDDYKIGTEEGYHGSFLDQFQADYGFQFDRRAVHNTPWVQDVNDCIVALYVISNNSPTSVGGGGTPRQPLAPAI
jgi:hypothetical protein